MMMMIWIILLLTFCVYIHQYMTESVWPIYPSLYLSGIGSKNKITHIFRQVLILHYFSTCCQKMADKSPEYSYIEQLIRSNYSNIVLLYYCIRLFIHPKFISKKINESIFCNHYRLIDWFIQKKIMVKQLVC